MTKIHIKNQAEVLRKNGYSIKEIADRLKISSSTASMWVRSVELSKDARDRINQRSIDARERASHTIRKNRMGRENVAITSAYNLASGLRLDKVSMYMLSAMIYECEGGKNGGFGVLEFTNSDPELVKVFLALLRKTFVLDESKFRVVMHLHSYHEEEKEKAFWSQVCGIPRNKFLKTFHKKESGIQRKTTYRGCVQIKYFDVNIKRVLLAGKHILITKLGL